MVVYLLVAVLLCFFYNISFVSNYTVLNLVEPIPYFYMLCMVSLVLHGFELHVSPGTYLPCKSRDGCTYNYYKINKATSRYSGFTWLFPRGEPRLELPVHVFGIMWNYFGIHYIMPLHLLSST